MIVNAFNKVWWSLLTINMLVLVLVKKFLETLKPIQRDAFIWWFSIAVMIYFIVYRLHVLKKYERGTPEYYNFLPLYPCNILAFILPIAITSGSSYVKSLTMLFGTVFPFMAILMPTDDVSNMSIFKSEASGFYIIHYGIWDLSVLYAIFNRPTSMIWILKGIITFIFILLIEHCINIYFRKKHIYDNANYGFTCDPENNAIFQKLRELIPIDFLYLMPILPVFAVFGILIHLLLTLI